MEQENDNKGLLEEFQRYWQENEFAPPAFNQPDLLTVLTEMAGLKAEVKAEARQFKATLDSLNSSLDMAKQTNHNLATDLERKAGEWAKQRQDIEQAMLLDVLEIYDRLSIGLDMLNGFKPVRHLFKRSRDRDIRFIESFRQGQAMTLRRLEQLLQRHQVTALECVGKMFDPLTMIAVETAHEPSLDNGVVLEELRKGFVIQDRTLRLAEVKVNKTSTRL